MVTLKDDTPKYSHIVFRDVLGQIEAYVSDTGLSVWEIAWLGRAYSGDAHAIAEHTGANPALIEEGLRYAAEHWEAIEAEITRHTERPLEEILELLPGMRVGTIEPGDRDGSGTHSFATIMGRMYLDRCRDCPPES